MALTYNKGQEEGKELINKLLEINKASKGVPIDCFSDNLPVLDEEKMRWIKANTRYVKTNAIVRRFPAP